ncbi:ethanolamine ammonia-lyase subunit EutC [Methylosarcina fibrata]|uniref:ethanolamine ammonia-lyase subunit EutC n=1 Tax=Methylosarcina fibrata TaxID=105972 RepID=UPI000381AD06|nr:ethanolamine ammonia-lyase subunit EutC [Methylosarcina fibrata]
MSDTDDPLIIPDPWHGLKQFTPARIALGRAGMSQPTRAGLDFQLAHALARDAVQLPLDFAGLEQRLNDRGCRTVILQTRAESRQQYLQRPDLGRRLSEAAVACLDRNPFPEADAVVVVADGLSSQAIERHAVPFLDLLLPRLYEMGYRLPPVCLIKQGRVAIGDEVAAHYAARLCIVLIGERPGLSSPDSMGIYFTYRASPGISTDADRNCISNIHPHGLGYEQALRKLLYLIRESEKLQLSGVLLKDETSEDAPMALQKTGNFLLD